MLANSNPNECVKNRMPHGQLKQTSDGLIRVVMRYDDCSERSSLELERRFIQVFAKWNCQVTMGVVPFVCAERFHDPSPQKLVPVSREKANMLRDAWRAGHIEVALHGYSHQMWHPTRRGELAGLELSEQCKRLREGKEELERGLDGTVSTLIPPWNAYDLRTLRAMELNQLTCISGGMGGPFPRKHRTVRFLPASCSIHELRAVVAASQGMRRLDPVFVVVLHDFDFVESGLKGNWLTIEQFDAIMGDLARMPAVRLSSVAQACDAGCNYLPESLVPRQAWRAVTCKLPYRLRSLLQEQVLWCHRLARQSALADLCFQSCVSLRRALAPLSRAVRR
jgi:hypothetical protein